VGVSDDNSPVEPKKGKKGVVGRCATEKNQVDEKTSMGSLRQGEGGSRKNRRQRKKKKKKKTKIVKPTKSDSWENRHSLKKAFGGGDGVKKKRAGDKFVLEHQDSPLRQKKEIRKVTLGATKTMRQTTKSVCRKPVTAIENQGGGKIDRQQNNTEYDEI